MLRRLALLVALVPTVGLVEAGCGVEAEGVPEGKLAVVGEVVLGPEDLAGVGSQLGSYAQLRFRGNEGRSALLEALVVAELLAQEAVEEGLGDDPRVRFAVLEEIATLHLNAELERRVPREEVASDVEALREYYDTHPEAFTIPERRSATGVVFEKLPEAREALEKLEHGLVELADLGDIVSTPLQERDDAEYPGFHRVLFESSVGAGELLTEPVVVGEGVLVGRVAAVEPAHLESLDDPAVQERLVQAVRAPRLEAARRALLQDLRARHPEQPL